MDVANWQGVDDTPADGNINLINGSGIYNFERRMNNYVPSYPNNGYIQDGVFTPYETVFLTSDFIECCDKVSLYGIFGTVLEGYYNVVGYDAEKRYVQDVARFTKEPDGYYANVNQIYSLNDNVRYIRIVTRTGLTNGIVFPYFNVAINNILEDIDKNTEDLESSSSKINAIVDTKAITECGNPSGLIGVGYDYGIGITDKLLKGTVIDYVDFTPSSITFDPCQYLVFVNNSGRVLAKFNIESLRVNLNYEVPEDGVLLYHNNTSSAQGNRPTPMGFAIVSNEVQGNTSILNYVIYESSMLNVGSVIAAPNYLYPHNMNVGCNVVCSTGNFMADQIKGKTITCLGDSITLGTIWTGSDWSVVDKPYPAVVSEILSCNCLNKGYGSYAISASGPEEHNSLLTVYQTIDHNSDYIIVLAGTNDHHYMVPIGNVDDDTDISFCGGINVLTNGLITNYPNAQIIFMTPIHKELETNRANVQLKEYVDAMKNVCARNGIPVIDLNAKSYISWNLVTHTAYYNDGLHLTQEGYTHLGKSVAQYIKGFLMSNYQ